MLVYYLANLHTNTPIYPCTMYMHDIYLLYLWVGEHVCICVCGNTQCSCMYSFVYIYICVYYILFARLFNHSFIHFICLCVAISLRSHYVFAFSCVCVLSFFMRTYAYVCVRERLVFLPMCAFIYVMSNWMWLASSSWFANCNLTFTFLLLFTQFTPNKALPLFCTYSSRF